MKGIPHHKERFAENLREFIEISARSQPGIHFRFQCPFGILSACACTGQLTVHLISGDAAGTGLSADDLSLRGNKGLLRFPAQLPQEHIDCGDTEGMPVSPEGRQQRCVEMRSGICS